MPAVPGPVSADPGGPAAGGEPGVWTFRAVWLALPLLVSPALGSALDPRSASVRTVATVLLWLAWMVALAAALVPRSASLTVVRIVAGGAPVAAAWAALVDDGPLWWEGAVAVTAACTAAVAALSPLLGDAFVDGSSYGTERRLALRVPARLLPLVGVTWAALVAGVLSGPLLLAARQWVVGAVVTVVGLAVAVVAARALHGLSRRWLVFVPAGLVVHDPMALADALLVPRGGVRAVGLATSGVEALDLTLGSLGLVCQVDLAEPTPVAQRRGRREVEAVTTTSVLVGPTRPGAFLTEARSRRFAMAVPRGGVPGGSDQPDASPPPTTSSPS